MVHRREDLFEDPDEFRPVRWNEIDDWPKYATFPFGGGDRFCIGSHFAMMEMPIILGRILQRVGFEVPTDSIDQLVPAATLRPGHPIDFTVKTID